MNKKQTLILVGSVVLLAVLLSLSPGMRQRPDIVPLTRQVGADLITKTNSPILDRLGWGLDQLLKGFLDASTKVTDVQAGDEPPPIGDGTASSRLILMNGRREQLGIRLKHDGQMFRVVGFWLPDDPAVRTNR